MRGEGDGEGQWPTSCTRAARKSAQLQQVETSVAKAMGRKMQKPMTRRASTAFICRARVKGEGSG